MGFQFADIIILALIAVFVILRLRNTLGKDLGDRPDTSRLRKQLGADTEERVIPMPGIDRKPVEDKKPEDEDELALAELQDPDVAKQLLVLKDLDAGFSVVSFMEGAKGAFEWVLTAFNDGDKDTLKRLLAKDVYEELANALDERNARDEKTFTTLVSIKNARITRAEISKKHIGRIAVEFTSEQIQVVRDHENKIVEGDPSKVREVIDEWVFERDTRSRNPNWTIIET